MRHKLLITNQVRLEWMYNKFSFLGSSSMHIASQRPLSPFPYIFFTSGTVFGSAGSGEGRTS